MKFDIDDSPYEAWVEERDRSVWVSKAKTEYGYVDRFYVSGPWINLRREVIEHFGRRCMKCNTAAGAIQVDHIKPRFYYPKLALDFNNMQVLCRDCNQEKGVNIVDYRPKPKL